MLARHDRDVLEFERRWWQLPGPKDRAIADYLGMPASVYYAALRRLLDDPAALRYDPLTVRRLRRLVGGFGEDLREA
ncbi:MAG: DUF3263 domain-containing protein [Acidimicrobiia bacterium]